MIDLVIRVRIKINIIIKKIATSRNCNKTKTIIKVIRVNRIIILGRFNRININNSINNLINNSINNSINNRIISLNNVNKVNNNKINNINNNKPVTKTNNHQRNKITTRNTKDYWKLNKKNNNKCNHQAMSKNTTKDQKIQARIIIKIRINHKKGTKRRIKN